MSDGASPSDSRRDAGFALIAVLWLLAALATLAAIYLGYALRSASASRLPGLRLQAEAALRSGVELTAYRLLAVPEPARPGAGAFETRIGAERLAVTFLSEGARVDLNSAPKELLSALIHALGVPAEAADSDADRIVGWRGGGKPDDKLKEQALYASARLPYGPRLGPFLDTLELSLIVGLPPALVERLLPRVTIYSGRGQIDVRNAAPEMLAALPGLTPDALRQALALRAAADPDPQALLQALGPARKYASLDPPKTVRARIVATLEGGSTVQAQVVLLLNEAGESPYEILYWRDDFEGAPDRG